MATNSINSASSAAHQVQQSRQAQQPQRAQQTQQPQHAQKLQQPQQAHPVTNMHGQRTGTVINTTA